MIFDLKKFLRFFPIVLFLATLAWYVALVIRYPTHGAIGTDPATYVQMALDLAQRGTVVHDFPLFTKLFDKGLSWDAFITPGYHIVRETGIVAPNFAFGFPLLLAFGYRIFGENALYWATPFMGALALIFTFALANELFRDVSTTRRYWIGALAVLLLATTPKQIQLALAPMSDVPTQLFCVLALWCALRARPDRFLTRPRNDARMAAHTTNASNSAPTWKPVRSCTYAALCGLSLGIAYLIRHSAIVLLVPLALAALRWGNTRREKFLLVVVAFIVFAITILPDVIYRAQVLGSPFAVESPESAQMNFYDAPRQFLQMLAALFSVTGLGPIILLAPFAWWMMWREKKGFTAAILISWILAFMLLHAPLVLTGVFENNLRYLLPAYPAIVLSISYGAVWILEHALREWRNARFRSRRALVFYAGACIVLIALLVAIRSVASPERFAARAYGWMSETARNDLDALNQQLPRDAVIGVSDQMAGATLLYAQRDIFRPANFLEPAREFPQFLETMKNENRAVFLLGDWECAGDASERLPEWVGERETRDWRLETRDLSRTSVRDWRLEIRDLPYECTQRVRAIKME